MWLCILLTLWFIDKSCICVDHTNHQILTICVNRTFSEFLLWHVTTLYVYIITRPVIRNIFLPYKYRRLTYCKCIFFYRDYINTSIETDILCQSMYLLVVYTNIYFVYCKRLFAILEILNHADMLINFCPTWIIFAIIFWLIYLIEASKL